MTKCKSFILTFEQRDYLRLTLYELSYCFILAADGTTKVVSGPTSILPKTPPTPGLNQQSVIRITPTSKSICYLNLK